MARKTILILTIPFGAGHANAAAVVARACGQRIPECQAQVIDVAEYMPRWFRWWYIDLYLFVLKIFPFVWRRVEAVQRERSHTAPLWMLRATAKRLGAAIQKLPVAAIVSTEVGVNEIAALLKRQLFPTAPLVAVLTDYDVDRAWIQEEVGVYCAGSEEVQEELWAAGAPKEKVVLTGIPVDERFLRPALEAPPRWQENFFPRPRILLAGGGEGLMDVKRLLFELNAIVKAATVTVLTGKNSKLYRSLLDLVGLTRIRLNVQGWTDEVHREFHTHDVLISKPGGLTMTEAMAAGMPLLACFPLPGSEVKHCTLVEEWGIGAAAESLDEFRKKAQDLLLDETKQKQVSDKALRLYVKQHARPVVEVLRQALGLPVSPNHQLQLEFNEWAGAGRGEQMEEHHRSIALATLERMNLRAEDRVLDLGCGNGWATRTIATKATAGKVLGVDISEVMVERARAHPENPAQVAFRVAGVEALPIPDASLDKVFSCESFYYFPDLKKALEEIFRVLKREGKFYCLVNLFKENPYTHAWMDLLKVKTHLLAAKKYEELFKEAGFAPVTTEQIPDQTPVDESRFKPGWGVNSVDELRQCRAIGALLIVGTKPLSKR